MASLISKKDSKYLFCCFNPTGWNSNYSLYKTNQKKGGHAGMHVDGASISKGKE